jgi:hypothetical protein
MDGGVDSEAVGMNREGHISLVGGRIIGKYVGICKSQSKEGSEFQRSRLRPAEDLEQVT